MGENTRLVLAGMDTAMTLTEVKAELFRHLSLRREEWDAEDRDGVRDARPTLPTHA